MRLDLYVSNVGVGVGVCVDRRGSKHTSQLVSECRRTVDDDLYSEDAFVFANALHCFCTGAEPSLIRLLRSESSPKKNEHLGGCDILTGSEPQEASKQLHFSFARTLAGILLLCCGVFD